MAYSDGSSVGVAQGVVGSAVDALIRWLPLAIVVALWAFASGRVVSTTFLPPPMAVFAEAASRTTNPEFLWDLTVSLYRVAIGLGLAILMGVTVGVSMAWSEKFPATAVPMSPKSILRWTLSAARSAARAPRWEPTPTILPVTPPIAPPAIPAAAALPATP
jgi:hypothetical protein